ncbi:protein of unknown function [Modestobacter italicus]|uniref:Uncharacterized protein n=1 Tax=Modestobacter italicus (strain DSM 44449 / CECT 9708 / BC 501) TaxID=2732864 RepID=I4F0L6_MODI5|nr:protein of unknown function [Modestobacter marinus]
MELLRRRWAVRIPWDCVRREPWYAMLCQRSHTQSGSLTAAGR